MGRYSSESLYGPTSQYTRIHQQNLAAELALGANPWLANDPSTLFAIANSGADPEDIITNASAIAGVQTIDTMAETLRGLTPVAQRAAYGKLSEQQQRALAQMGYEPEGRDKGGWFDNGPLAGAFDVAGDALGVATRPVGVVMSGVGKPALDMLAWVGDVPAHFYRAIRQMDSWQQWLALGAGVGLAVATRGQVTGAFAGMGSLAQAGALGGTALAGATLATAPTAITNPSEWWDVMNPFGATGVRRGERIFSGSAQQRARELLGNAEIFDTLARDVAAEIDVYDIAAEFAGVQNASAESVMVQSLERVASKMAEPGTAEFQQVYLGLTKLMEQPEFREAVDVLQQGKISFGRDVAGTLQLEPGDFGYGLVSGSADALWLLTMDPLLAMGKLGKVQRLWRRGIDTPSGPDAIARIADMINDDPAIRGVVSRVTDAVERESFRDVPKQWRPLFTDMLEWKRAQRAKGIQGEFDTEMFMEWVRTGDAMKQIAKGRATVKGVEQVILSGQNSGQGWSRFVDSVRRFQKGLEDVRLEESFRLEAKRFGVEGNFDSMMVRNYMDHSIDMKFDLHDFRSGESLVRPELTNTAGYQYGRQVGTALKVVPGGRTLQEMIIGLTTMIPAGQALKLTGSSADDFRDIAEDMPRFVEAMGKMMNLPSYVRDEWLDTIMRQPNVAMRRNAALSFLDSTFAATGWHSTAEFRAVADEIIRKTKQAYGLGGVDNVMTPLGERILGTYPVLDQAVYLVMPDIREMTKVVRSGFMLKHVAKLVDADLAEQAMSRVIKPGWLMRIGFIPRAAGEEMLAFWLRMSEGGLAQEFAARSVAKRSAFHDAQIALIKAKGNKQLLTPDQLHALDNPLPAIYSPLVAVGRRIGWNAPESQLLNTWADWQADFLRKGLGRSNTVYGDIDRVNGNIVLGGSKLPAWADELLLGRDASVRRMIIGGTNPELLEAGNDWLRMHASSIMRAASTSSTSDFERARFNPPAAHIYSDDVSALGRREDTTILLRGEKGRAIQGDPQHKNGVYDQATRWTRDPILAGAAEKVIPAYLPPSVQIDEAWLADAYEKLNNVQSYASRQILSEVLAFRDDNWRAAWNKLGQIDENLAEVLAGTTHHGRFDIDEMRAAIEGLRYKMVPVVVDGEEHFQKAIDMAEYSRLVGIHDEIKEVLDLVKGVEGMDVSTANWVGMKFSEFWASDDPAKLISNLRNISTGGRPKNVLYRGLQPGEFWYNADGSLTVRLSTQGQWGGDKRALSMSIRPEEALTYASQSVTDATGARRLGNGVVIQIDGDYLASINNQTWDDIRKSGRSYRGQGGELVREDGLRFIGHEGEEATEVALVMPDEEITIPAGHFETMTSDGMKAIVENAGDTKWTERIHGIQWDINGMEIDEATIALVDSWGEFRGTLTAAEQNTLREIYAERQADYRAALEAQFVNLNEQVEMPDPVFGNMILTGQLDAADEGDAFAEKVLDYLNKEIGPNVTVRDVMLAYLQGNKSPYAADDLFMAGAVGQDAHLFGAVDNDIMGVNDAAFSGGGDLVGTIYNSSVRGRGLGGFDDAKTWSPFYRDFNDFREAMVTEVVNQLHRPENQETLKLAEQALHTPDQVSIVRPPADGTARIYTPVVPPNSRVVDEILDGWPAQLEMNTTQQLDSIESILFNPASMEEHPLEVIDQYVIDMMDNLSDEEWMYVQEAFEPYLSATDEFREFRVDPTARPNLDFEAFLEEYSWDDVQLSLIEALDELRGPAYRDAAQRLIDRSNWVLADELADLSVEKRLDLVAEALKHYKASRARYQLGMTQALDGIAVDDPRLARYVSNLFSSDPTQVPRVGVLTVPRTAPNRSGAGLDGLTLRDHDEVFGRRYQVHEMYRDKAQPMDAEAFQRIGYKYTDYRGQEVEALEFVPGRSIEESVRAYAEQAVDTMLNNTRRGVKEAQVYNPKHGRNTKVARRGESSFEELTPGETTYSREDLVEIGEDGEVLGPVPFGDNRYFDHDIRSQEDDLMWAIVGPAMRDRFEQKAGLSRVVTRSFREESGFVPGRLSIESENLDPNEFVTMTRSRVDDVDAEPSATLPNVALTQAYDTLPNTVWDRFIRWGFDKVIGPSIDAFARKPMAFHYYAAAHRQHKRQISWMLDRQLFDDVLPEMFPDLFAYFNGGGGGLQPVDIVPLRSAFGDLVPIAPGTEVTDDDVITWVVNSMRQDRRRFLADIQEAHDRLDDAKWLEAANAHPEAYAMDNRMAELFEEEKEILINKLRFNRAGEDAFELTPDEEGIAWLNASQRLDREFERDRIEQEIFELAASTPTGIRQEHLRWLGDTVENDPVKLMESWRLRSTDGRPYSEIFVQDLKMRLADEDWETVTAFNAAMIENEIPLEVSFDQFQALKAAKENMGHIDAIASEVALYRAVDNVIPFLDSHEQRSLFAEYGRNFIPFWYAEENFIKRWARTFALGELGIPGRSKLPNWAKHITIPSGGLDQLRKAQLTYMGLRSAGVIRTDANGEDWVVYPGSGLLTEAVAKLLPGDVQPIGVLFAATTDSMLPGVSPDNTIAPTPFIGVPTTFLAHFFPDVKPVKDAMLGPIGSQRGIIDQFVPSMAGNMWEAVFADEESSVRYASAMMSAIAYAEAEGRGLPDNASSDQIEEYLDKIRNHTRIIMVSQALTGYVVPGAPRPLTTDASGMEWLTGVGVEDPEEILSEQYRAYVKNLGMEEGVAQFLKDYPNADLEDVIQPLALTASGTYSVSGAPLPATELGMDWYERNADWVDSLPDAGAWFLPQAGSDEFEYTAYRQQLVSGLRKRRNPTEFIRSLKFRTAADTYFSVKDEYEAMVLEAGDDQDYRRALDAQWDTWKSVFLAAHPIFNEELQNGRARSRRARTVDQLRYAIGDPQSPDSPYKDAIKDMVEVYDEFSATAKIYREMGTAEAKENLRELRRRFEAFGDAWVMENPELERMWTSVYRIEAGIK